MVGESELEGFRRDRYFARSWALLTRDHGWIKPVLLMTVSLLVPLVGALGVMGYVYEWARLTAWGVNSAPKQKGVRVGECIASGWRVFVVCLVWYVGFTIVSGILLSVPVIGDLLDLVWTLVTVCFALLAGVASMRATIYQKIVPGLRVPTIWKMISHDPVGLLRIAGIQIIAGIIIGLVASIVALPALFSVIPNLVTMVEYLEYSTVFSSGMQARIIMQALFSVLAAIGPTLIVLVLVCCFFGSVVALVSVNAIALWMRQFNVVAWGRDEDPLPPFVSDPRDAAQQAGGWQYGVPPQPAAGEAPTPRQPSWTAPAPERPSDVPDDASGSSESAPAAPAQDASFSPSAEPAQPSEPAEPDEVTPFNTSDPTPPEAERPSED